MNIGRYVKMYSDDLKLKNYSSNTIENYCSQVKLFLEKFDSIATKPSEISEKQIKAWLLETNTMNSRKHRLSAVKLFYSLTGKQPLKLRHIEYPRSERKLPIILSQSEIQRLFTVCANTKHKVILALLYSCGLRVSELINLKWKDIDRERMVIMIKDAKGHKDRQVQLSANIIPLLEKYYREYKSKIYVLNGQFEIKYSDTSIRQILKQLGEKAKINKRIYPHLLRHNCFSDMVAQGTDIGLIQRIAGHRSQKTTAIYLHISDSIISRISSPIQNIAI